MTKCWSSVALLSACVVQLIASPIISYAQPGLTVTAKPDDPAAPQCRVRVESAPVVLSDKIRGQWGGHSFGYLLEGKRGVFWSAAAYNKSDGKIQTTAIVGQYPKPGSNLPINTTIIKISDPSYTACNQPQMIRTPDGYIHVFVGVTCKTDKPDINPGRIRYYRSSRPEDITTLVDRTSLIPTEPYNCFHLRMNVGVSADGSRMALAVLAWSPEQKFGFNTPIVFIGKRSGLDFAFRQPTKYAEPMAFFYPQVAATNAGIVLVGQNWNDHVRVGTRLMHLSWNGELLYTEDIPSLTDGFYMSYDMRPTGAGWEKLLIYCAKSPNDKAIPSSHDFLQYDTKARKLSLIRSVETDYGKANAGKLVLVSTG